MTTYKRRKKTWGECGLGETEEEQRDLIRRRNVTAFILNQSTNHPKAAKRARMSWREKI